MPAPVGQTTETRATEPGQRDQAALARLAEELTLRGFSTDLKVPHGTLAYLIVRNPEARVMTETVYARDNTYWWSWREKLAPCDDPAMAAGIVAHVLRAVAGD